MAIKLYKSQLTPTAGDSNVADTRQINLGEAQSIGKAMKGMLQSGEKLYIKHLDIKSDNELLENLIIKPKVSLVNQTLYHRYGTILNLAGFGFSAWNNDFDYPLIYKSLNLSFFDGAVFHKIDYVAKLKMFGIVRNENNSFKLPKNHF